MNTQWVDIEQLKSQADVLEVLSYYTIDFTQQGDDLVCACPLPFMLVIAAARPLSASLCLKKSLTV